MTDEDKDRWRDRRFALHDQWEGVNKNLKEKLPNQKDVHKSRVSRFFGKTLLRPELWTFHEETVARGAAIGMFVAFTPTIGIQMILSCIVVLFIPGNLPIALAACWITNPITAAPIYYVEYLVGAAILGFFGIEFSDTFEKGMSLSSMMDVGWTLWFGSIIVSIVLALMTYYGVHGFMALERKVRFEKLIHFRSKRKNGKKEESENND